MEPHTLQLNQELQHRDLHLRQYKIDNLYLNVSTFALIANYHVKRDTKMVGNKKKLAQKKKANSVCWNGFWGSRKVRC